jgi:hypothetical protein
MDGRKTDDEAIGRIGIGADKDSNTLNSHTLPGKLQLACNGRGDRLSRTASVKIDIR